MYTYLEVQVLGVEGGGHDVQHGAAVDGEQQAEVGMRRAQRRQVRGRHTTVIREAGGVGVEEQADEP